MREPHFGATADTRGGVASRAPDSKLHHLNPSKHRPAHPGSQREPEAQRSPGLAGGHTGCWGKSCSNHISLQVAAGGESEHAPPEKGERDLPQLWPEFRLGVGKNFLTSGGSSQKRLENISTCRKGFLSFFSYVPVGGPCPSLSLPFYSDITRASTVCQVCGIKSHDPQRPCFGTGVYSA